MKTELYAIINENYEFFSHLKLLDAPNFDVVWCKSKIRTFKDLKTAIKKCAEIDRLTFEKCSPIKIELREVEE